MKKLNIIVMDVAGLLFIVASVLKMHQLLTEPILSKGFWESWLFFVIQIPLELGLGIWLTSRLFRKAAWLIALLSFAGFICVMIQTAARKQWNLVALNINGLIAWIKHLIS